jgi:hypothetical protein
MPVTLVKREDSSMGVRRDWSEPGGWRHAEISRCFRWGLRSLTDIPKICRDSKVSGSFAYGWLEPRIFTEHITVKRVNLPSMLSRSASLMRGTLTESEMV